MLSGVVGRLGVLLQCLVIAVGPKIIQGSFPFF